MRAGNGHAFLGSSVTFQAVRVFAGSRSERGHSNGYAAISPSVAPKPCETASNTRTAAAGVTPPYASTTPAACSLSAREVRACFQPPDLRAARPSQPWGRCPPACDRFSRAHRRPGCRTRHTTYTPSKRSWRAASPAAGHKARLCAAVGFTPGPGRTRPVRGSVVPFMAAIHEVHVSEQGLVVVAPPPVSDTTGRLAPPPSRAAGRGLIASPIVRAATDARAGGAGRTFRRSTCGPWPGSAVVGEGVRCGRSAAAGARR